MAPKLPSPLRPNRVRTRLSVLYAGTFTATGAILLAVLYVLVESSPRSNFNVIQRGGGPLGEDGTATVDPGTLGGEVARQLQEQAERQHDAEMENLLVKSALALAIMVVVSLLIGWLVAHRILRPLRTMTATIQGISARNLHERLDAKGSHDEMKDLSDTVDALLQRLETALNAHKRFVANAAHELRTPLTLEHALIEETLIDPGADVAAFRAASQRVLEICRQQERLLESLLTLTTGERGLDRREPVDLARLADEVLATARDAMDRRRLRAETAIAPARTSGDPALVERLVGNLIDNAISYNVPGGRVQVRTWTDGGRAVVSVANTGRVIPPDKVDRLFEPFHRLDRTVGRGWNHGLGLSIVQAIAAAHGATLTAVARQEGGLGVAVSFPAEAEPVAAALGRRDTARGTMLVRER